MIDPRFIQPRPVAGVKRPFKIGVKKRTDADIKRALVSDQLVEGVRQEDWERAVDDGFAGEVTQAVNGLLVSKGMAPLPAFPIGGN